MDATAVKSERLLQIYSNADGAVARAIVPDGNQAINAGRETEVDGAEILVIEVLVDNAEFLIYLEDGERNFLANFLDLIALGEATTQMRHRWT